LVQKKSTFIFLASFGNHQYGLSGEIRNNTIPKNGIECSVLGLLRRKRKRDKFKECPFDAGLNRIGHLVFTTVSSEMLTCNDFGGWR
jgi:hypothetical protein